MIVVLLGAPGSGKGTQGIPLGQRLGLAHVASGDMFRDHLRAGTELGQRAKEYYDRGALVPDDLVIGLVMEKLREVERAEPPLVGALFDGFPRNRRQAESLDAALADVGERIDAVVNLDAPREVLLERLSGRLICATCGTIYHLRTKPPQVPGVCDVCGGHTFIQRPDDTPEAIRERLRLYDEQTEPLLEYYRSRGIVREVDGDQPIEAVTADLLRALRDGQE